MNRKPAVWFMVGLSLICIMGTLSGCFPQRIKPDFQTTGSTLMTPQPTPTPAPTPEPELTTLEQAFIFAESRVRAMPLNDPRSVFPHGNQALLSSWELANATPYELEWGRREIVARAGIKNFRTYDFTDREWYEPDPDFSNEKLTQTEAMNLINIRNTALEHYAAMKVVKNARASADLDGDGRKESFSFSVDRFNNEGTLQIGSTRFTIVHPMLDTKLYLCDIGKDDGMQELAVLFTENGIDYSTAFYRYREGSLMLMGAVKGDRETIRLFGDGNLDAHGLETELFGVWRYRQHWRISGDALVPAAATSRTIGITTTLLTALTLTDYDGFPFSIPEGETVCLIMITPQRECILYHPGSGRMGMFTIEEDDTIGGLHSTEIFSPLPTFA